MPQPILRVQSISVTFPDSHGGLQALRDVSFEIFPQEFICIVGPSGSGKSTLLRVLAGLLNPTNGKVKFVKEQPRIGFVFQESNFQGDDIFLQQVDSEDDSLEGNVAPIL